jgi:hypothetical protein
MIKLVEIKVVGPSKLDLDFSDGTRGTWSAEELLRRDTVLTRPLSNEGFFSRAFLDAGALAWPNGLELSGSSLHAKLGGAGQLRRTA